MITILRRILDMMNELSINVWYEAQEALESGELSMAEREEYNSFCDEYRLAHPEEF
jgi:hypothetical protein